MKKIMMMAAIAATMAATAQVLTPTTGVANDHGYGATRPVSVAYAPRTTATGYGYEDVLAANSLDDMRTYIITPVGNDSQHVGHLDGGYADLALADTHGHHRVAVP